MVFVPAPGLRQLSVAQFLDFNPKEWLLTGIYLSQTTSFIFYQNSFCVCVFLVFFTS